MELNKLTIRQAHQGLKDKKFSAVELASSCFQQIEKNEEKIKAFITLCTEKALKEAKKADEKIEKEEKIELLAGIPYAAKDLYCTKGVQTTAGSKILEGFVPPYDATVIKKLKEAGSVLLGKNTEDEFGHGASSENTGFAVPHNPWDLSRVCGGSSGGSAAAVCAYQAFYSLGTDTGGSIRQPASMCGIVGLKPSYGRVSRFGVIAMASSLDTIGCMARTVSDTAEVMKVMAGRDQYDSTTLDQEVPDYAEMTRKDLKGIKVGVPKEYFIDGIEEGVLKAVKESIDTLKKLGAEIKEISLPHTKYGVAAYYIICPCEVSANMAKFDGVRYGPTKPDVKDLEEMYLENRTKFHAEVKRRIMIGTYALSSGYYDAYYLKAQKIRTLVKQDFDQAFQEVDVICAPTSPTTAFKIGERSSDPLAMYMSDVFTIPASLAGLCGLNVPCGFSNGLPVGLQIIGPQFEEKRILEAGACYEENRGIEFEVNL